MEKVGNSWDWSRDIPYNYNAYHIKSGMIKLDEVF